MHAALRALTGRLSRWLLPARCLLCGAPGAQQRDLCELCLDAMPHNHSACAHCALPLPSAAPACGRCLRRPPPFDAALAAYRYEAPIDRLLPRFKFHGDLAAGRELATGLFERVRAAPRPQALVPVPLHRLRLRERGFDQALELARPLARALDLPLAPRLLQRVRCTVPQTTLDAAARRRNLRDAFAVDASRLPQHVALLDDVLTTGATLAECARTLRRAGVQRIDVWVVARAPAPHSR